MLMLVALLMLYSSSVCAQSLELHREDVTFAPFENDFIKVLSVVQLSADDERFGGISALSVFEGEWILGVTDQGNLLRFDHTFSKVDIQPLLTAQGRRFSDSEQADAESLAVLPDGKIFISFERFHRVERYTSDGQLLPSSVKAFPDISFLPNNNGIEAMESLSDGRLVLIAEEDPDDGLVPLWIQKKDNGWQRSDLTAFDGFKPTGLARVPGSDKMILLERFFSPISGLDIRLSEFDPISGERGHRLAGFPEEFPLDNFEGIFVEKDEEDKTVITLIADDNFNKFQRTLLMKILYKN